MGFGWYCAVKYVNWIKYQFTSYSSCNLLLTHPVLCLSLTVLYDIKSHLKVIRRTYKFFCSKGNLTNAKSNRWLPTEPTVLSLNVQNYRADKYTVSTKRFSTYVNHSYSSRAALMDSSRSNDGFIKEPEAKLQVIYFIGNVNNFIWSEVLEQCAVVINPNGYWMYWCSAVSLFGTWLAWMKEIIWCVPNNRPPKLGCKLTHTDHMIWNGLLSLTVQQSWDMNGLVYMQAKEAYYHRAHSIFKTVFTPKGTRYANTRLRPYLY